jgi:hypothetical protein
MQDTGFYTVEQAAEFLVLAPGRVLRIYYAPATPNQYPPLAREKREERFSKTLRGCREV